MKPPFLRIYIGNSKNLEISLQNVNKDHLSEILSLHLKNILSEKEDDSQISIYVLPSEREEIINIEEDRDLEEKTKNDCLKDSNKNNNYSETNSNNFYFENNEKEDFYDYIARYSEEDQNILKRFYQEKNDVLLAGWQGFVEEKDFEELNDTIKRFISKHGNKKNNFKKNKNKINEEKNSKQVLKQTNFIEDEQKEILCSIEDKLQNKKKNKKLKSEIFDVLVNNQFIIINKLGFHQFKWAKSEQ